MSSFELHIDLDNAGWRDEDDDIDAAALAEAIRAVADAITDNDAALVVDPNGNRSGSWRIYD